MKCKQAVLPALVLATLAGVAACGTATAATAADRTAAHSTAADSPAARASGTPLYRWGMFARDKQDESTTPAAVAGVKGRIVQIATSNSDTYALTSDGTVWALGAGSYGELGNGTTAQDVTRAVKVSFPAGVKITALPNPMPYDAALAIDSRGHAWTWGFDLSGDLCQTGLTDLPELRPRLVPGLSDVTLATGARGHSLFDSHGKVYACGSGVDGVLGDGSTASSSKPVAVTGLPATARVTALTSSWNGSGALLSNGAYYDWGYNAAGQLGDGTTANSDVPVHVKLPAPVRQVSQGGSLADNGQTLAMLADNSLWTWGANRAGQLGDGTTARSDVPVRVHVPAGVSFVKVNSGGSTSYAIDSSGRLWAWGNNAKGQLGTGSSVTDETSPVDVGIHLAQVSSTASNAAGLATAPWAG